MNDLNSSPSVSPGQKKVDIVSIIIALIATTFIITGTYLLVQALKPAARSTSSVVAVSSRSSSSRTVISSSSSSLSEAAVVSMSSVAPVVSSSSLALAVSSAPISSSASSAMPVVLPITNGLKTGKTDAQILARVDGGDAQVTKLVVTESGFTGTRWLQKGAFVNVSNGTLPVKTVGTIYKINFLIGDSQTTFEIKDISGVEKQ